MIKILFGKGNKKQVSLRLQNQFPCETSFPVKPLLDAEVL